MSRACLYCGKIIEKESLSWLMGKDDPLCPDCRSSLKGQWRSCVIQGHKVHYLYDYGPSSSFREMLIQFKEAYDEALAPVFLYPYLNELKFLYFGYSLVCVPSTKKRIEERGFETLKLITKNLSFHYKEVKLIKELCQKGADLEARRQMSHNFVTNSRFFPNEKILIFDDVLTSGSSLVGVYNALVPAKPKIKFFALSVSEKALKR